MRCAAFNFKSHRGKSVFVLISYPQNICRKETEWMGLPKKKKNTCDFCDKHPVIQIITLLGEIKYVLEPPT